MKHTRLVVVGMTALLGMTMGKASAEKAPKNSIEHSTFDERRIKRNPFLPIGWTKVAESNDTTAVFVSAESFKVTSIVVDSGGGLAIVNGEACGPGEVVMTPVNGRQVPVRVKEVRDGEVVFFHNGKPIVAPLIAK